MIENSVKTEIDTLLGSGEKIIWEGKPLFSPYYIKKVFEIFLGFIIISILFGFLFQFLALILSSFNGNLSQILGEAVPLILISFLIAGGIVVFYQFFNTYFKGKATYFFITNKRVIIKELNKIRSFNLAEINKIDFYSGTFDRSFFGKIGTLEFEYPSDLSNKNPDLRFAKYYLSTIENVSKVFEILKNEVLSVNSKVEYRNELTPDRIFSSINYHLDSDEKIIWKDEKNYSLVHSKTVFLFLLFIPFFVVFIALIIKTLGDYDINSSYLAFIYFLLILILGYVFIYLLSLAYEVSYHHVAFYMSNKKLFFMRNAGDEVTYYSPYLCDISEILSLENLNEKKDTYTKYRIISKFYETFYSKRFYKIFMKHRDIYLDEKGLQILTKLIKEQSPNARIKL